MLTLPLSQLLKWYWYYQREPWGWEVEENRHSVLCAMVGNAPSYMPKAPYKPSQFLLTPDVATKEGKTKPPSAEEIKRKMNM